jgi:hypothetical protein
MIRKMRQSLKELQDRIQVSMDKRRWSGHRWKKPALAVATSKFHYAKQFRFRDPIQVRVSMILKLFNDVFQL